METDWRKILRFSQKELKKGEKERLCESLSWVEADDIELNFTDLKSLFRLAQDILKYKTEQVNSLMGQMDKSKRKVKTKEKSTTTDSPAIGSDTILETIAHQEEVIKANKDILEQLYADIAELEGRKNRHGEGELMEKESESSRGTLSEINTIAQLQNEITRRNKHIRKLLGDIKIMEEENNTFREKLMIFKDKLREATLLIENLTEQLFTINRENSKLKDLIGQMEEEKTKCVIETTNLKKEISDNKIINEKLEHDLQSKIQHLKNLSKSQKKEIESLTIENIQLKEDISQKPNPYVSPKKTLEEEIKMKELQNKLLEASEELVKSANLIQILKNENKHLKLVIEDFPENSVSEHKNESDDGKEKRLINKLKKKLNNLSSALRDAEETISVKEKELTEISAQLKLLRSDEGVNALIEGIKSKKKHLKIKDEGIKSLVQEVNTLNQLVSDLEVENEIMRDKLQIPMNEKISKHGILKKYKNLQKENATLSKQLQECESKMISLEIDKHEMKSITNRINNKDKNISKVENKEENISISMQAILEENEGLRNGLTEILTFLKDNSNTTSGILTMECPSLEAILNSMEARKAAGWFSPHMKTVMELKEALGGKDALMSALHESRKDFLQIMNKLTAEEEKSSELQKTIFEINSNRKEKKETEDKISSTADLNIGEFGTWISNNKYANIDFNDDNQIHTIISNGQNMFKNDIFQALQYFQDKFTMLFEKLKCLTITATDDLNRWLIQEEHYKAEIENLKSQIDETGDDFSNCSPGLLSSPKLNITDRKYNYLQESYRQIRTLNENLKNEYLDSKKDRMNEASDYERKIQNLILTILNLSNDLGNSIPVKLFLKQNTILNQYILKYRNIMERNANRQTESLNLLKRLDEDKLDITKHFHINTDSINNEKMEKILTSVEQTIYQKQLEQICLELKNKNKEFEILENRILDLQTSQSELIDKMLTTEDNEEINYYKNEMKKVNTENNILKDQMKHTQNELENKLLQLKAFEHKKINNELEINMLRHQIIDLQSTGDSKAIIARLSGEILLAQKQTSECYEKVEILKIALQKEKELRAETEEILLNRQTIFDVYCKRNNKKFRRMFEALEVLRHQYSGSLPLISVENFLQTIEQLQTKEQDAEEKLKEIEDLQSNLMPKHSVYSQILNLTSTKCFQDQEICSHKLKNMITEKTQTLELDYKNKKLLSVEEMNAKLLERCNELERTLVLVNQSIEITPSVNKHHLNIIQNEKLDVQDVQSDGEKSSRSSRTYTLLQQPPNNINSDGNITKIRDSKLSVSTQTSNYQKSAYSQTQIGPNLEFTVVKSTQTDDDLKLTEYNSEINKLLKENKHKENLLENANIFSQKQSQELVFLNQEKIKFVNELQNMLKTINEKNEINKNLQKTNECLKKELNNFKTNQELQINTINETVSAENQVLIAQLRKIETDKNDIIIEYKELLEKERQEYLKSLTDLKIKLTDLHAKLDERQSKEIAVNDDIIKETDIKYTTKISELENKSFKLESDLEEYNTKLKTQQGELERWKNLASERLTKMEHLGGQLKERHHHEMESYKAENQHWLTQLNETQREHMELRSRLIEQRSLHLKQMAEKDTHIEQLRSIVNNLKTQMLNMQTMLTNNDPNFDLSAIVEVDEVSDAVSQQESDRLELKFDSTGDLNEAQEDFLRIPSSSTAIWQEPLIERLRREKQLMAKQNAILRRQIKVLAARERRSRLDAQNLKNQVFRISTSGSKVASVESASLQNKIATLQAQLTSARREAHSSVALWDKWKRAKQTAERWEARYEEKCQEIKKLEMSLTLAKSAVARLEKEKRVLLTRLGDVKYEKQLAIEKQDMEAPEKAQSTTDYFLCPPPVSARALLDRVEAQQRRIAALELAEKGNETLVSEYEKCLAEITSLKGQVLKLESTLLEAQIRSPLKSPIDTKPELEYWKNYCDMLKEENVQLTLRVNSLEHTPTSTNQQRVNDLEQTVLTLRGLVSKLQAEQKTSSTSMQRRIDSARPRSSGSDKVRSQIDSHRTEIANLRRSILEKDALLEKSKDMLKIAAEREEELLRENTLLRRRLEQLTENKGRIMSA